ncbi:MAG: hypothetical protein FWG63_01375 [Defluviitaleaceae bacterium]|nr:hypothetical protein [Defluviitaleaceae bacterium]
MDKLKYSQYEWQIILQNVDTGTQYNITNITTEATYTTELMTGNAGTLELQLVNIPDELSAKKGTETVDFLTKVDANKHGHTVQFSISGEGIFLGYITNVEITEQHNFKITARDSIFWLKSKDYLYTEDMTASDIFADVASRKANINHAVRVGSSAVLKPYNYSFDYTMFAQIEHAIKAAILAEPGNWYIIRDEFGTLVFTELSELFTGIILGDLPVRQAGDEYAISYKYNSTIEQETYNYIKAFRPNEDIGMFDTWVAKDSDNISRWGQLNKIVEVDKEMTDAEVYRHTRELLVFHNLPTETFSIKAFGHIGVYAGNGITLQIGKIGQQGPPAGRAGHYWVEKAKHTFRNNYHVMDLELFYFNG